MVEIFDLDSNSPAVIIEKKKEKSPFSSAGATKISKALRAAVKMSEMVTDTEIPKPLKVALKCTKAVKILRFPPKIKKLTKNLSRLATDDQSKKGMDLLFVIKGTRSTVAGALSIYCLLDDFGIISPVIPTDAIRAFKVVNPFLKPVSICLAAKSFAKTVKLNSDLRSIRLMISEALPEEKIEAAQLALTELGKLKPKRLQSKLCLAKEVGLEKKIVSLQGRLQKRGGEDAVDEAATLVGTIESKANMLLVCKGVRTAAKVGIVAGRVLLLAGIAPVPAHILIYGSILISFANWGIQKLLFRH